MKIIFFFLLVSLNVLALEQDEDCLSGSPTNQASLKDLSDLSIPNCMTKKNMMFAGNNNLTPLCNCKKDFDKFDNATMFPPADPMTKEKMRKMTAKVALEGLVKARTNNFIKIANAGAAGLSQKHQGSFELAKVACRSKSIEDYTKDCKSKEGVKFLQNSDLLKNLGSMEAAEFARVGLANHQGKTGLLNRSDRPESLKSCPVSEFDTQQALYRAAESVIAPELIEKLKKLLT